MKIGMGLYSHKLNRDHYRFAKQVGATHVVANLVDYFGSTTQLQSASADGRAMSRTQKNKPLWTYEMLRDLKREINDEGLELAALENFDPAHWYDVLLGGPERDRQLENMKQMIRAMGKAEIPVMGYNFSIAGVWGHRQGPWSRGGAESVAFFADEVANTPMPKNQVWSIEYDEDAPDNEFVQMSNDQLWNNLQTFLEVLTPVAAEEGVTLSAHPDDPPMPTVRQTPRLVYEAHHYRRLLGLAPVDANKITFCIGTFSEMQNTDVYQAIDEYAGIEKIAYVHLRNVKGKVPQYYEVFLDEGDTDLIRILHQLHQVGFDGVIMLGHTPRMTCGEPWHAGMAWQVGWLRAALSFIEAE